MLNIILFFRWVCELCRKACCCIYPHFLLSKTQFQPMQSLTGGRNTLITYRKEKQVPSLDTPEACLIWYVTYIHARLLMKLCCDWVWVDVTSTITGFVAADVIGMYKYRMSRTSALYREHKVHCTMKDTADTHRLYEREMLSDVSILNRTHHEQHANGFFSHWAQTAHMKHSKTHGLEHD